MTVAGRYEWSGVDHGNYSNAWRPSRIVVSKRRSIHFRRAQQRSRNELSGVAELQNSDNAVMYYLYSRFIKKESETSKTINKRTVKTRFAAPRSTRTINSVTRKRLFKKKHRDQFGLHGMKKKREKGSAVVFCSIYICMCARVLQYSIYKHVKSGIKRILNCCPPKYGWVMYSFRYPARCAVIL